MWKRIVAGRLLGLVPPVLIGGEQRLAGRRDAEIDDHRRAAGKRRLGARFEIVGRHRAHERHFQMGVRVDAARHHDSSRRHRSISAPAGASSFVADGDDGLAVDEDVGALGMIVVHDGAAADQNGHGGLPNWDAGSCRVKHVGRSGNGRRRSRQSTARRPVLRHSFFAASVTACVQAPSGFLVITGSEPPGSSVVDRAVVGGRVELAVEPSVSLLISPIMRFWWFSVWAPARRCRGRSAPPRPDWRRA